MYTPNPDNGFKELRQMKQGHRPAPRPATVPSAPAPSVPSWHPTPAPPPPAPKRQAPTAFTPASLATFATKRTKSDDEEWIQFFKYSSTFMHRSLFTAYLLEMYPRECCATIHTLRMTMVKGTFKDEVLVSTAGESEQYPAKEFAHALFKSGMLLEKRFIVIPVNLMYVIGEEKFGHSQVLLLDPSRKQSFFIDPMNDSFVRLSANAGKDPAQIFKESDMLIKLLQKHFFDPVPEFKNTFTRGIINATAAMLDVNKFFRVSRPHTVSPNYECPLAYYAVLPIILYWPLLSDAPAFQPAMERHPVRVLNALLHHFVCRSYSSSYPPKVSFIDHIFERMTVTPETAAQFLARPGTTEFDVECRSSTHAWKNFDSFIRVVVEGYMDPYAVRSIGAKPGVLTDLAQAKWFEPGFKVTPEERKVYEGKVKEFSVFLVQLLTDAVKRHRPDLPG